MTEKDMEEKVNMNVLIAERLYPLRANKVDEEKLRDAVKLVNDRIREYQKLYEGKDKQDYMAMCLLNFAVEHVNAQNKQQSEWHALEEKLTELERTLTGVSL